MAEIFGKLILTMLLETESEGFFLEFFEWLVMCDLTHECFLLCSLHPSGQNLRDS